MNVADRPNRLDDTIQESNPVRYPNMYTSAVILVVMSVSTSTAEGHSVPCDAKVTTDACRD